MGGQLISPVFQFPNGAMGTPSGLHRIYSYAAGTDTPQAVYQDAALATPHNNPVLMNASGFQTIFVGNLPYKFVGTDTQDRVIWTKDNCSQYFVGQKSLVAIQAGNVLNAINLGLVPLTAGGAQVLVNNLGEWNGGATFTAGVAGKYRIWGVIDFIETAATTGMAAAAQLLQVNRAGVLFNFFFNWPFADSLLRKMSVPFSCMATLAAGQTLQVVMQLAFAGTPPTGQINGMQIERIT